MLNGKWQKKEKSDAKLFGGRRQKRSGGLWFQPGDVKLKEFLIDDKQTDHKSFSVTKTIWEKIAHEALMSKREPCLSLQIQDVEVVVLDKNYFLSLFKEKT